MKEKLLKLYQKTNRMLEIISGHYTGAHAAQSAYFFVLSMIPIIVLLLTLVKYTPLTEEVVINAVAIAFPSTVNAMIVSIVTQVYNRSANFIPIMIIVALWSAGKGVLSMTSGLNKIYDCEETRNYIVLRLRASFYTLVFLIAIVVSLILSVFGNSLSLFLVEHFPFMDQILELILSVRTLGTFLVLAVCWVLIYRYLPNRKDKLYKQIPGAIFTSSGWMIVSFFFSIYLDIFKGFTTMYGSMTTIVLILLWLYFCMYIVLLGGEVNVLFPTIRRNIRELFFAKNADIEKLSR